MSRLYIPGLFAAMIVSTPAQAGTYTLGGKLYIQVFKDPDTLGAGLSHDHVMVAQNWTGSATYDSADPSGCNISITVPVSNLDVDPDYMRQAVGYDTLLSEGQRDDVRTNMLAASQLNADAHPNISFQSTSCTASSVSGNLTIRGSTQPVTMQATIEEDGSQFSLRGQLSIRATQFGFQPYSAMLGQLKNRDDMTLTVRVSNQ